MVRAGIASLCILLALCGIGRSSTVYTIDSENSYLDVVDFPEQFTGSGRLSFTGHIDVDFDTGTVQFRDTSSLTAVLQPFDVQPAIGGGTEKSPGSDPGNAGVVLTLDDDPIGVAALRDVTSTIFSTDPIAITDDTFPLDGMTLGVTTGSLDYNIPSLSLIGSTDISESSANNANEGVGGFFSGGDILAFPITLILNVSGFTVTLDGQMVANIETMRSVPEPGSLSLVAIGLIAFVPYGIRRLRR